MTIAWLTAWFVAVALLIALAVFTSARWAFGCMAGEPVRYEAQQETDYYTLAERIPKLAKLTQAAKVEANAKAVKAFVAWQCGDK